MPVNDTIYSAVKNALIKDGWTITDDPLTIEYGDLYLFIDLGARRTVAAIRGDKLIAVEIKSFPSKSKVADLQQAVGQYAVYCSVMRRVEPARKLYLAVSKDIYNGVFESPMGELVRSDLGIHMIVVDLANEEIVSWVA
jgi:XisH protein